MTKRMALMQRLSEVAGTRRSSPPPHTRTPSKGLRASGAASMSLDECTNGLTSSLSRWGSLLDAVEATTKSNNWT